MTAKDSATGLKPSASPTLAQLRNVPVCSSYQLTVKGKKEKKLPRASHYVFTISRVGFKLVLTEQSLLELGAPARLHVISQQEAAQPGCQQKTD